MASYIYIKNLNEISQVIFSILYGKIKKNKTQHKSFVHWSLRSPYNRTPLEYQLQPHAKFELNPSTSLRDSVWKWKNLKSI